MADISRELEAWRTAQFGRQVRQAQIDLSNKLNDEVIHNTMDVQHGLETVNAATIRADTAAQNANTAATAANNIKNTVQQKLDNGDFIGPRGPQGNDGVAVITQIAPGMFALAVNSDGHLILSHNDNEPTPPFEIVDGRLIYKID